MGFESDCRLQPSQDVYRPWLRFVWQQVSVAIVHFVSEAFDLRRYHVRHGSDKQMTSERHAKIRKPYNIGASRYMFEPRLHLHDVQGNVAGKSMIKPSF